jgi:deoxyribonuclease V
MGDDVACWMGLATGLPAVGCAKESLIHFDQWPGPARGDWAPVRREGAVVGAALRPQPGVKPVFVSAGHRLDLDAALAVTLGLGGEYRVPEGLRRADQVARARSRGEAASSWAELGALAPVAAPWDGEEG